MIEQQGSETTDREEVEEHQQAQEAAETGRAELQSVFDSSPNAILIADLQGNIRACNHAAMDVLGCSGDRIVGRNFLDFVAVQDHIRAREDMRRVVAQNTLKNIQYSALRANGSPFVAEASTGVIRGGDGQATALVTIATDVTEREWTKASRRLSHQILEISNQHAMRTPMLRQIVLAIQEFTQCEAVGIRILDKKGGIPYEAYTGFSREFYEMESPLSIQNDHCMCINVIRGETDPSLPFYTARGSFYMNGTTRFLATVSEEDKGRTRNICNETGFESVALIPIRSNDDILGLIHLADSREHRVPLSLVETIENVAMEMGVAVRRAMVEEALRKSEERYRLLFDQMLSGLALHEVVYDAAGNPVDYRFLSVNAAFERMTGLRADEIVGKTVLEVMPGIEQFWIERYGRVASTGEPVRFEEFSRALNRHFDVRAYSPQQGRFATVFHDITEQKLAEQRAEQRQAELLHVSRLSTLGEMASGLAHELNQPLSAIMSFASACLRSIQKNDFDPQKLAANLDKVVTQCGRAGDIIRRIRAFVQRRPPKFESVDVNESIREVLGLLHSNIRCAGVEVILELARDLPPILGDTIQLEQVLVNLMHNAIEAMEAVDPQRRRLTVRTTALSRDCVSVAVSDTGPGMSEKVRSRIFDPFFTTKEHGLGIGLSISRSIIESHRGHLSVAPGPECGCEFTFTLLTSGARDGPAEPQAG